MSSQLEIAGIEGLCLVRVEKIDQKIPGNLQINRKLRSKKIYAILQRSRSVLFQIKLFLAAYFVTMIGLAFRYIEVANEPEERLWTSQFMFC